MPETASVQSEIRAIQKLNLNATNNCLLLAEFVKELPCHIIRRVKARTIRHPSESIADNFNFLVIWIKPRRFLKQEFQLNRHAHVGCHRATLLRSQGSVTSTKPADDDLVFAEIVVVSKKFHVLVADIEPVECAGPRPIDVDATRCIQTLVYVSVVVDVEINEHSHKDSAGTVALQIVDPVRFVARDGFSLMVRDTDVPIHQRYSVTMPIWRDVIEAGVFGKECRGLYP